MLWGIAILLPSITLASVHSTTVYTTVDEETPRAEKIVLIREHVEWTPERVQQEILKVFPDAPIMVQVAKCESGFKPEAHNPTNNSHDKGIFQISTKYHGAKLEALGLDPYDVRDNLAYARMLYDQSGLKPWDWSKPCWSK